jgi:hypothetical protein
MEFVAFLGFEMNVSIPSAVVVPLFAPADEESASTAIGFIMKGLSVIY